MYLHAHLRLANATGLAVILAASLVGCGGDTDAPRTLDALRADADAVSTGQAGTARVLAGEETTDGRPASRPGAL